MIKFFGFVKKYKYILIVLFLISLYFLVFSLKIKKVYDTPIGGWSEIKKKLESEFKYNEDIKNAALQMGAAIQKSIDYPENAAVVDLELSSAMDCVYAILELQKVDVDQIIDIILKIRDISVSNEAERVMRYIRFNANLSGGMYPGFVDDVTKCNFKPLGVTNIERK